MTLEDLRAPIEEEERLDRVLDRLVNDARILIGKLRKSAEADGRPPPCMGTRGAGHGSVTREVTLSSP
jgi:hypothetical protein